MINKASRATLKQNLDISFALHSMSGLKLACKYATEDGK